MRTDIEMYPLRKKRLDSILKEMIKATEIKDSYKVKELNRDFEKVYCLVSNQEDRISTYDNCRQSCLMAFNKIGIVKISHEICLKDAKSKYQHIQNAKHFTETMSGK